MSAALLVFSLVVGLAACCAAVGALIGIPVRTLLLLPGVAPWRLCRVRRLASASRGPWTVTLLRSFLLLLLFLLRLVPDAAEKGHE